MVRFELGFVLIRHGKGKQVEQRLGPHALAGSVHGKFRRFQGERKTHPVVGIVDFDGLDEVRNFLSRREVYAAIGGFGRCHGGGAGAGRGLGLLLGVAGRHGHPGKGAGCIGEGRRAGS
ncbi:hypothetical protein ACVOMV_13620 [Mesorhizobium atlanticum]